MSRFAPILLTSLFFACTIWPSCSYPTGDETLETDNEFFENALRRLCPIKRQDGSICESPEYKKIKSEEKLKEERVRLDNKKKLVAYKYCCKKKTCILECRQSSLLEGFPQNRPLLEALDYKYFKNIIYYQAFKIWKNDDTLNSLDRMVFESTDHYEKLMLRKSPSVTFELMHYGFRQYSKLMNGFFATLLPHLFEALQKLDSKVFLGLPESLQQKLSNQSTYPHDIDKNELSYWNLIVALHEQSFKRAHSRMNNF